MLPELQGRLPIRVGLNSLEESDFKRILTEPENSLIKQYTALIGTEKIKLVFKEKGVAKLAKLASEINKNIENIGARRLHTIMEKLLEELSFKASDMKTQEIIIDEAYVDKHVGDLIKDQDLSKFIL
tara:strand:- start:109 stop:489 length:381 start_codon:yes stop_codon:yes gene_type:complete